MTKSKGQREPIGALVSMFHATPFYNLHPILKAGIDPARSTGAREVSWYVNESLIEWSIDHVMKKYELAQFEVLVLEVLQPPGLFVNAPTPGTYFSYTRFRIVGCFPAEQWLARSE